MAFTFDMKKYGHLLSPEENSLLTVAARILPDYPDASSDELIDGIKAALIVKWQAELRKKALNARRDKALRRAELVMASNPDSGTINYATPEEVSHVLKSVLFRGYKTSTYYNEEGMETLKFWREDMEEPFDDV